MTPVVNRKPAVQPEIRRRFNMIIILNHISANWSGVCEDYQGNIYLCDTYTGMYVIKQSDHIIVPFATSTNFGIISSMTMDADNKNIYVSAGHKIFEISSDGSTTVVAGLDSLGNKDGSGAFASFWRCNGHLYGSRQ